MASQSKKEKIAAKKAEEQAKKDKKQANKLELAKAKNPVPISYGESSALIGGDTPDTPSGGIPWLWIAVLGVGGFLAWQWIKRH